MSTVKLTVDSSGKVQAEEGFNWPADGGHFIINRKGNVKWAGDYQGGNFEVTFFDVNDGLKPGWPFDPPAQIPLIVEGDGNPKQVLKLKDSDALWKYEVSAPDAIALDPMIIVRDSSQNLMDFAIPVLAFLVGVAVATFFRRGRNTRSP